MALYLKYRPRDFTSIVWQDFVKNTLQKAVSSDKTVWAYLFCWPRWTGKTSSARIMAKAVNCTNTKNWNPCNSCAICEGVNNENLVDVIEIDAASHRWIDNIRELIEKAKFNPTTAKYKIYIIDEVHMLTKEAFNALLKILEEPPVFVKFILATTETHKVPETIISRCQRYDFKRINENDIKNRLNFIASEENITIDDKSLNYIAKTSGGWLRNAISLFEQLVSDDKINYDDIIKTLWIVKDDILENFLNKLIEGDSSIINDYEELISSGKNIKLFFKELIFFTKELTIKKALKNKDINTYLKILDILDDTYTKTKNSLDENTTFLIGILKLVSNYTEICHSELDSESIAKPKTKQSSPQPSPKGEGVASVKKTENKTIKKEVKEKLLAVPAEDLSHNDISDIFSTYENPTCHSELDSESNQKKDPEWPKEIPLGASSGWQSNFNTENFIKELKKLWAKGWLTMSIRASELSLSSEKLNIQFKTSFALKSVDNPDNIAVLYSGLQAMWLSDIKITLK